MRLVRAIESGKNGQLRQIAVLSLLLLSGCTIVNPVVPETGHYYISPQADFASIGKVVLLEPANTTDYPAISVELAQSLTQALQKKHVFNVTIMPRTGPAWQELDLDRSSYSMEEMKEMRQKLHADAVIVGTVTEYNPYPRLLVGLNVRMLDLRSAKLVWGMEQMWDSTDKDVERRMRSFYGNKMRTGYAPMEWQLLITSPRAFHKFVAWEVCETLPDAHEYMKLRISSRTGSDFRKTVPLGPKKAPSGAETLKSPSVVSTIGK